MGNLSILLSRLVVGKYRTFLIQVDMIALAPNQIKKLFDLARNTEVSIVQFFVDEDTGSISLLDYYNRLYYVEPDGDNIVHLNSETFEVAFNKLPIVRDINGAVKA